MLSRFLNCLKYLGTVNKCLANAQLDDFSSISWRKSSGGSKEDLAARAFVSFESKDPIPKPAQNIS